MDPSRVGKATARRLSMASRQVGRSARPSARSFVRPSVLVTSEPASRASTSMPGRWRSSNVPGHPAFGNGRYRTTRHSTIAPHPSQIASAAAAQQSGPAQRRGTEGERPTPPVPTPDRRGGARRPRRQRVPATTRRRLGRSLATEPDQSRRTGGLDRVAAPIDDGQCDAHDDGEPAQPQPDRDGALRRSI